MITCHCCGGPAPRASHTPERDAGFGTCERCAREIAQDNEDEWRNLEELVRLALQPKNRETFDAMEVAVRRGVIVELIERGLIRWLEVKRT